jgi:hypothetical protein
VLPVGLESALQPLRQQGKAGSRAGGGADQKPQWAPLLISPLAVPPPAVNKPSAASECVALEEMGPASWTTKNCTLPACRHPPCAWGRPLSSWRAAPPGHHPPAGRSSALASAAPLPPPRAELQGTGFAGRWGGSSSGPTEGVSAGAAAVLLLSSRHGVAWRGVVWRGMHMQSMPTLFPRTQKQHGSAAATAAATASHAIHAPAPEAAWRHRQRSNASWACSLCWKAPM